MITFLSGGTGTPKLLQGARKVLDDPEISVIVNTGEDIRYQGGHISPDVDTVTYLFAGILNTTTWWGIAGDTFTTHGIIREYLPDAFISIGDLDRAFQIIRADLLEKGLTLTEVTREICRHLGISANIVPMSNDRWTTLVRTAAGDMHFQEYWVRHRGNIPLTAVIHDPIPCPPAAPGALDAIRRAETVIIGPSNPVTSILPILSCSGIREELQGKKVIAVSPFIGDQPVSGPAGQLMEVMGYQADSSGVMKMYEGIVDLFIQDTRDPVHVPGAARYDTLMKTPEIAGNLMRAILSHT
ncbi:MAG: 2-phospho-L-lactate transferase [Methanospirillum sp.]|nr:2-phospho-L-lactate transferase [Methanospirillum sp.]